MAAAIPRSVRTEDGSSQRSLCKCLIDDQLPEGESGPAHTQGKGWLWEQQLHALPFANNC
jgi:hypothetical protein